MPHNRIQSTARTLAAVALALAGSGCVSSSRHEQAGSGDYRAANLRPYEVRGKRYAPRVDARYEERGLASWYSYPAGTRRTATGAWFDPRQLTAAHRTLPLPCIAEVTNLDNGKTLKVLVNDRGPFVDGRIIDLSRAAAEKLAFADKGLARVRVRFVGPARKLAAVKGAEAYSLGGEAVVLAMVSDRPSTP